MSRIVYFTRFLPTLERGGGSRRTMQIIETLRDLNIEVISAPRGDGLESDAFNRINEAAGNLDTTTGNNTPPDLALWNTQRRRGVFRLKEISRAWKENHLLFKDISLALVDDPLYFPSLVEALEKKSALMVSICHNIESLAAGQVAEDSAMRLLQREIRMLKSSDLVVTISREEDWLLNNLGLSSHFFPYFPVESVKKRMATIRERRKGTKKNGYLVMGTAHNIQTRQGMQRLLNVWYRHKLSKKYGPLRIAGYGTENFIKLPAPNEGIELLGSLPEQELDTELSQTKGCICYQESGAGALTRIPELLLAHVPVLANTYAARTYSGNRGILEFRRMEDLPMVLDANENEAILIPKQSPPEQQILVNKIKGLLQ
jgi:hypothetical protein